MVNPQDNWDFGKDMPPTGLSGPLAALWWLAKGKWRTGPDWEKAHQLCQQNEGTMAADWVHALAHGIEGDANNSAYWYRRAGQARFSDNTEAEWAHIRAQISQA